MDDEMSTLISGIVGIIVVCLILCGLICVYCKCAYTLLKSERHKYCSVNQNRGPHLDPNFSNNLISGSLTGLNQFPRRHTSVTTGQAFSFDLGDEPVDGNVAIELHVPALKRQKTQEEDAKSTTHL